MSKTVMQIAVAGSRWPGACMIRRKSPFKILEKPS